MKNCDTASWELFARNPDPIWVFDIHTLKFLDVNGAALRKYGYTLDEFLGLTVDQIGSPEDVRVLVAAPANPVTDLGMVSHRVKSGDSIFVNITGFHTRHDDSDAMVVTIRDVTGLAGLKQENAALLVREKLLREQAETTARYFQLLFESIPGKFLVVTPEQYEIVAVSDAYLKAVMAERSHLIGRRVFDAFPNNPAEPEADGTIMLLKSLERACDTGVADVMAVQRYPIPRPAALGGGFEERFWSAVNTPVKGPEGQVAYIVHRVEDVTDLVRDALSAPEDNPHGDIAARTDALALDVILRSRELNEVYQQLQEQHANMRTAQRLLGIGIWRLDLHNDELRWSENVYEICGVSADDFPHNFDGYYSLIHPDDQQEFLVDFERFLNGPGDHYHFENRLIRPDGRVVWVKGAGEITYSERSRILTGVVQDVTAEVEARNRLVTLSTSLRLAGKAARLGGWRYNIGTQTLFWTGETAAIHEEPDGFQPSIHHVLDYYDPETQQRIRDMYYRCADSGVPFDELIPLTTRKGNRIWVRTIGEAQYGDDQQVLSINGALQDVTEFVMTRNRSEELSRRLVDSLQNMSDAFFAVDESWCFTFINKQAENILRRSRSELLGKCIWEVFPATANSAFETEYRRAVRDQVAVRFIEYYLPLEKWIEVNAHPGPNTLAVYFRDTTAERSKDKQLRLLETAVSQLNDILLITEAEPLDAPDGPKIVFVNDAFETTTGYTREEVIGKTPRILQGPETSKEESARIRDALNKRLPVRAELLNYTKSGAQIWLDLNIVPLSDETGRHTHWVSVERDITSRKLDESRIHLSDERFRLLACTTNDVIWDWNIIENVVWWNDSMETLFGYPPMVTSEYADFWSDHVHPEDRGRVLAAIDETIRTGKLYWEEEYRFIHADGRVRLISDRGTVIRDAAGVALRMIGNMADITERRELDEQLHQSQKMELIGQLTGGVAHDFNNLLTVILGNTELLAEELAGEPEMAELAEMAVEAAERGAELTNRLLAFARRQALKPELVDVNQLLKGITALLRRALFENIVVTIQSEEALWSIEVDPAQLESAILNIAVNARDAMPSGGTLVITTANVCLETEDFDLVDIVRRDPIPAGDYVTIELSDNGFGMAPEVKARVFEPFFTTKDIGKGSGLGLSMVLGFVKQSHGHILLNSEPGKGTTVKVCFPRASANDQVYPEAKPVNMIASGGNERILAVEDNIMVREHLIAQLKTLGYRVTGASNGREALELLEQIEIDLLLTDIIMPGGINGRELADAALLIRPNLKILFTSGFTDGTVEEDGRLISGVNLLTKPYRRQELALKVRQVLGEGKGSDIH